MTTLTSTLIVRLLDKVTSPAKSVAKSLTGITDAAGRFGRTGTMMDRLGAAVERNNAALDRARGRLVDAAAGFGVLAAAIGAPIKAATDFETKLEDIGQKLNMPQEQFGSFGKSIRKLARDTTQSASAIAGGIDVLAGMGANEGDTLAMMPAIGKAATAYRAEISDLAAAGYAALDNLKVPAEQFGRALDSMAQAGKAGAFELRDMAQYFPSLTAAYQGLGQKGVPAVSDLASALQIARKGAGDSAEAATNLSNVLQKINAPQTHKAFKDMGVNLEKELAKAAKAGLTPIEAIAEITNRTLKGDLGKLGDLFQDAQVQKGLRPLIQNIEEYRRIRREAMKAQGVVEEDYQRRLKTTNGALQRLRVVTENVALSVGSALLPVLADLGDKLAPIADAIARFAEANPALTRTLVGVTAGLIGFNVAAIGVQYAALLARGGLLSTVGPFVKVASWAKAAAGGSIALQTALAGMSGGSLTGLQKLSVGLGGIVRAIPGMSMLTEAFSAISTAVAAISVPLLPVVAGVAAVAAAGALIYKYWEPLKAFFSGFFSGLASGLAPLGQLIMTAFDPIISVIGPIVKPLLEWIGSAVSGIVQWFRDLLTPVSAASETTKSWGEAGKLAGEAVASAIRMVIAPLEAVIGLIATASAKFGEWKAKAGEAIGGAAQSVKNWWNGDSKPGVAGARAKGGPVRAGSTYLVGEEGPELWRAPGNGRIIPNARTMAAVRGYSQASLGGGRGSGAAGGVMVNAPITVSGVSDPEAAAKRAADLLADAVSSAMRSVHADIGVG